MEQTCHCPTSYQAQMAALQRKEKQKRELNETPSLISIQVNLNSSISFLHQSHALVLRHEEHSQCANKPHDMLNWHFSKQNKLWFIFNFYGMRL